MRRPKLRGSTEAFASRLPGSHVTKTLESLVIASFVRAGRLPARPVASPSSGRAVLDRASRGWRRLTMTSDGLRLLRDLRRLLLEPPRQRPAGRRHRRVNGHV